LALVDNLVANVFKVLTEVSITSASLSYLKLIITPGTTVNKVEITVVNFSHPDTFGSVRVSHKPPRV
jgi:hypothetical protein